MNPQVLEFFVRVAHAGSISRAAIELGIEQSTMTRNIARLEADVGTRLFHRSGRGVLLTDAGRLLLERAEAVQLALDDARRVAAQLAARGPGRLVIAAQPTLAQRGFPAIGYALKQRFPDTQLRMVEALGHQIVNWLVEGRIDVALLYVPLQASVVDVDVLMREPLYLVAAAGVSGMADDRVSVQRMLGLPLILPSTPHGLRALAESLAARFGAPLRLAIECDGSTVVTRRLVEAGLGYTILPLAAVADEIERGTLQATRLVEPTLDREIAIATARNRPAVVGHWEVMQTIRQVIGDLVARGRWPGVSAMRQPQSGE